MIPEREHLGRLVRETWVTYCREIGDDKPSHLAPWEELSEDDKEADRRIGEAVARHMLAALDRAERERAAAESTLAEVANYCIGMLEHIPDHAHRGRYTPPEYDAVEDIIDIINPPTPAQEAQMKADMDGWMAYMDAFNAGTGEAFIYYDEWRDGKRPAPATPAQP